MGQDLFVLLVMDVDIDVRSLGNFQGIWHLKAVTTSHTDPRKQLIEVGRAVRRTNLNGLLKGSVQGLFFLLWIGDVGHVNARIPSQGNTN